MKAYVLLFLLVSLFPSVYAAAPSIDSLSPSNNTVYTSSDSATITVTATDDDSDPINYSFRTIPSVIMINDSWRFSGCAADSSPVNGTNFSVKNRVRALDSGCTAIATANFYINTNELRLEYDIDETAASATGILYIGGDQIFSEAAGSLTNLSINTTKYNNGSSILIEFDIIGSVAFNTYTLSWWFPQYKEGRSSIDGSGNTLVQSIYVQNSSSQTYTLSRFEQLNHVAPWKWGVKVCDNNSGCVNSDNFTTTFSVFDTCTNPFYREAFNVTVVDENTNNTLNSTVNFVLNVSDEDSSNKEVLNVVSSGTNSNSYRFCSDPYFITHELNNFLDYLPDDNDYTNTRFYWFLDTPTNPLAPLKIELQALNDTLATIVTVTVKRSASVVSDATVELIRLDSSTGKSKTVHICRTDSSGQCSVLAQTNDALYRFVVISNGQTALSTTFAQITKNTQTLNLPELFNDPSNVFRQLIGITYDLTYDNSTTSFTCTFADNNLETITTTLTVDDIGIRETTQVNTSTVSSTSGSLTISVPRINGTTYKATCSAVLADGTNAILDTYLITIPKGENIFGSMGWLLFTLTAIVLSLVFITNPMAALILNSINLLIHKIIGTIPLDWSIVIGFITVIMIIAIYTRVDRR